MFSKGDMTITAPTPPVAIHIGYVTKKKIVTFAHKISCASLYSNF